MAKKLASRTAQYPLVQEFSVNYNDWAVDSVSGVKKTVASTVANSTDPAEPGLTAGTNLVFDAIPLPLGAVIIGGEVIVETAFNGTGTNTLSVGTSGATTAYASAVDLETAARTALTLTTPLASNNGQNIRLTFANGGADATAGKVRVRVMYTIDNRAQENSLT